MFFFILAFVCSLVCSLPLVSPVVRDVWVPKVMSPDANAVWLVGGTYTVTWDTSSKPYNVTNPQGMVYLRIHDETQMENPLARGFPLTDGRVNVTIPADTQPSNEWIVVLFGDSGNWSPLFTIKSS